MFIMMYLTMTLSQDLSTMVQEQGDIVDKSGWSLLKGM